MSSGQAGGPHATRGFTTAQLLELAIVGLTKLYTAQGQAPTVTENGVTRQMNLANSHLVSDKVATSLGITLPKGTKMHVMDKMVKAGWFHDGRGQGDNARPFAAISPEGLAIQAKRPQIYDIANGVIRELTNPARYQAHVVGGVQRAPAGSGELEPMLRSSYSWGTKKGQTLQTRINALQQVWALTDRNQEPPPPARTGGGGGGFGAPRPASRAQADLEIGQSNGFLNRNLAKFLSKHISKRAVGNPSAQQLQAAAAVGQVIRQLLNIQPGFNLAMEQAKLLQNQSNPKQLFDAVVQALGGAAQAKQVLWLAASTAAVKELIGGFTINKPNWQDQTGKEHKDWIHVPTATGQNPEGGAQEFTRYVYNQLFDRYVAGGGVDRQSAEAAAKSERRRGSNGLLGTDDIALKDLIGSDAKKVAAFVGKARKGLYTMEALRAGAQKLNIQVDAGAILHDTVIQSILDQTVRAYSAGVGAHADQTMAVAAALGITGFSKGIRDAETMQAAKDAILRKLDAQNGRLTAPCNKANYKKKDLKRIAKAHQISTDKIKTVETACLALSNAGVQREAASADVISSGRRAETAKPRAPSQAKSGKRSGTRAPTILEGLAGTNYSPTRAQGLAAFMGGQPQQFQPQATAFPQVTQPLSGSRSRSPSPTRRATAQPTLSGGLGGLGTFGGLGQQATMGGVAPSVISTQPTAGGGLNFPAATGGADINPLLGYL